MTALRHCLAVLCLALAAPALAQGDAPAADGSTASQPAATGTPQPAAQRTISGRATYLPRIALPADARLQIEARSPFGDSLALGETPTDGAQVPLPFSLRVPAGQEALLRLALESGPDTLWLSDAVKVPPGDSDLAVGDVTLRAFAPVGPDAELLCKDGRFRIGFAGDDAILVTSPGSVPLHIAISASGARFLSDDQKTEVWTKANTALVTVDGVDLGECQFVPPALPASFVAKGNEPGWVLTIEGGRISFDPQEGDSKDWAQPDATIENGAFVYRSTDPQVTVRLGWQLCADSMTGMRYPVQVTVETGDKTLSGCGGDPLALLVGPEWQVEDVQGGGIIDSSHITLQFGSDGTVSGSGGCNHFTGTVEINGETLRFGPIAGTLMACADALMQQEDRFHEALRQVTGFDVDDTGALTLLAAEKAVITARR